MSLGLIPLGTRPLGLGPVTASSGTTGSLAWTEQNDVSSITAFAQGGALAWTEANDTASLTGTVTVIGALAWTEANDISAITGSVGGGQSASLAWTEADDVTALAGTITDRAALAWTEDADVTSITGAVLQSVSGQLAWTESDDTTYIQANTTAQGGRHGFEMVSMEPSWKRALRLRAEAKQIGLDRKKRKRAEFIEKLAAKEALSDKPEPQIERRIESLLAEWVDLAPKLDLTPVAQVPPDDAYNAFMARVAEQIRRMEDEDDENAAEMLLLM